MGTDKNEKFKYWQAIDDSPLEENLIQIEGSQKIK